MADAMEKGPGDYGHRIARVMGMSDAVWARHANPWSVWTRVPLLPLIALSLYARAWIGWWCLVPFLALQVWAYLNPRVLPPPASTDTWASRATFGERIWLNRSVLPIPPHHARMAQILSAVMVVSALVGIYGIVVLDPWASAAGVSVCVLAKLWFCDRMVWLYQDMKDADEAYRAWLR